MNENECTDLAAKMDKNVPSKNIFSFMLSAFDIFFGATGARLRHSMLWGDGRKMWRHCGQMYIPHREYSVYSVQA